MMVVAEVYVFSGSAVLDQYPAAAHLVAFMVETEIGGDTIEPRPEIQGKLDSRIGAICTQPGLLKNIERVFAVIGHAERQPHYFTLMAADNQFLESGSFHASLFFLQTLVVSRFSQVDSFHRHITQQTRNREK